MPSLFEIKNDLEALAAALGIENIRTGKKYKCPFHADKSPSLSVKKLDSGYYWRCWAGCGRGSIVDAIAKRDGVTPEDAIRSLSCVTAGPRRERPYRRKSGQPGMPSTDPTPPTPKACRLDSTLDAIRDQNMERPEGLVKALQYRGINIDVAAAHDVSHFPEIQFRARNRTHGYMRAWMITVCDADGRARAVKIHREHVTGGESKSGWLPVGEFVGDKARHGWPALFPSPETYDSDSLPACISDWPPEAIDAFERERELCQQFNIGVEAEIDFQIDAAAESYVRAQDKKKNPVLSTRLLYLCPGELKALAVISAGLDATAPTTGEGEKLSAGLLRRLSGRRIVLVYDDDDAGRKFRDAVVAALQCRCPELRTVTLGRAGDKKIDANDFARENGINALRLKLTELVADAPNVAKKPFDLDEHRVGLRDALSAALSASSGLHVFRAVVGAGKSHTVSELLVENDNLRAVIFAATHDLAKEYEARIPGALRVVSPEQADKDGLILNTEMIPAKCPSLSAIGRARKNNLPYSQICDSCPLAGGCPVVGQRSKMQSARVLILQFAHLKMLQKEEYSRGRVRIIDETALSGMAWRVMFDDEKIASFRAMLATFGASDEGSGHERVLDALNEALPAILRLEPGKSIVPNGAAECYQDKGFVGDFSKFLRTGANGYNLAPDLLEAIRGQRFIRCGMAQKDNIVFREYWMIRGALPDTSQPCIILDATAPLEAYSQLFGDTRLMTSWPEGDMPAPESEVIQLVDGLYCRRSLHDGEKPTGTFTSICEEVRAIAKAKGIKPEEIGLITLKKLVGALHVEFPEVPVEHVMWYGNLRGLNALKDCKIVALVGCQPPPDSALAWSAVTLNNLDVAPESLLSGRGRKWKSTPCDGGYDVQSVDLKDPRLNLAWDLAVTSELVQAIGRARPYAKRDFKQLVLVYCNQPLPMPVTRCCTRAELQRSLGLASKADVEDRVRQAMKDLASVGQFGMADLAAKLGVSESTLLSNKRFLDARGKARDAMGLLYNRVGTRWVYTCPESKSTLLPKDIFSGTKVDFVSDTHKPFVVNDLFSSVRSPSRFAGESVGASGEPPKDILGGVGRGLLALDD